MQNWNLNVFYYYSIHASTRRQKQAKMVIFPQTPRWILIFLLILISTYYNKSNCNVKVTSEQTLIEMSISNGVHWPMPYIANLLITWFHEFPILNSRIFKNLLTNKIVLTKKKPQQKEKICSECLIIRDWEFVRSFGDLNEKFIRLQIPQDYKTCWLENYVLICADHHYFLLFM